MADNSAAASSANRAEALIARRRAAGGTPNRLIDEGSPYLLQHAYNPVDWYPWGDEAFAAAADADKPVFVSIGYSTCHWCHVMEHESFEDAATAAVLNEHFINVKIDREERPDVDRIYMSVVQAVTGSGGWPMSVFLTPQRQPFYAGTYFPPRPVYGRPAFREVLLFLAGRWRERRAEVEATAARITTAVRQVAGGTAAMPGPAPEAAPSALLAAVTDGLAESFDARYGGFGSAPKFPRPAVFTALFHHYRRSGSEQALEMARETLHAMARGGMYDHLGGGFHRYSVDRYWRVPHFEKMLYDQAQLAAAYATAHQVTGDPACAAVAAATLNYLLHDLQAPEGGFYSAEDADSARDPQQPEDKVEGAFYLWRIDEVRAAFAAAGGAAAAEADEMIAAYGLTAGGNTISDPQGEFGSGNVLYRARGEGPLPGHWRDALLAARDGRARPLLDDKVIAAWNGLAIEALAVAGRVLGRSDFVAAAAAAAGFARRELMRDGRLLRRYRAGEARHAAGLADYAFLVGGLIELYQSGGELWTLEWAGELADAILEQFVAPNGALYDTPGGQSDLIMRTSELYDSAEPSGPAAAILGLLRLGRLLGNRDWEQAARRALAGVAATAAAQPTAAPLLAVAADLAGHPPVEVVLAGDWEQTAPLRRQLARHYLPDAVAVHLQPAAAAWWQRRHPAVAAMAEAGPAARAYVCRDFTCDLPVSTAADLARQLAAIAPGSGRGSG
ncbi:MAG: thioredoxin domain-containing protein [Spirochaetaceae bacterium]|nr:thioredoxin domain-containing protein [Spirochaetaceae bacterium]